MASKKVVQIANRFYTYCRFMKIEQIRIHASRIKDYSTDMTGCIKAVESVIRHSKQDDYNTIVGLSIVSYPYDKKRLILKLSWNGYNMGRFRIIHTSKTAGYQECFPHVRQIHKVIGFNLMSISTKKISRIC